MSELQEGAEPIEPPEGDQPGEAEGIATPTEGQPENDQDSAAEKHQREVNRQHKKFRDEERARLKVEAELEEERKTRQELEAKLNVAPEVPETIDPYDDDYEAKTAGRDAALLAKARWDAEQEVRQQTQQAQLQQQQAKEQEQFNTDLTTYYQKADEYGVNQTELKAAEDVLLDYGVSGDLLRFIVKDAEGPLITKYLASNPIELDSLRGMDVGSAAVHLATTVKPKAGELKPQTTQAPPPPEVSAGGIPQSTERGPPGATYE